MTCELNEQISPQAMFPNLALSHLGIPVTAGIFELAFKS
jgi:hypothetical protein